ncbi:Ras guanyl-nucleotide exchange factor RasGEF [Aspergillus bombycis]|uniref:Ras guanyl-nucleotide exchange factor RasGEF n=1 Tax=Aspergillus bombycis TaxID=109264 RepID=A0A1F8ABV0_9EURO|nr:Ras guanyl-nucleotide exchange factor RasGEF [Aspergillus bombycis]OGM49163.1 Ras guanyl-nucleotide exchange factor RasGEF [Aspergillus bombycis]
MSLQAQARSTYRALLRELPRRSLSNPTPLHNRIRELYRDHIKSANEETLNTHIQEAEQVAQYARAQRQYIALVERYNPGMTLDEQEKIRLTARRVGLNLPIEAKDQKGE